MKSVIIDTGAMLLMLEGKIPEKWHRIWRDIRMEKQRVLLSEPVITEMFYKGAQKFGMKSVMEKILWLKSLKSSEIHRIDDRDAFSAGKIKMEYLHYGLSIVDCYLLALGKSTHSIILTTDHAVRDVARRIKIGCNYLPYPSLSQ